MYASCTDTSSPLLSSSRPASTAGCSLHVAHTLQAQTPVRQSRWRERTAKAVLGEPRPRHGRAPVRSRAQRAQAGAQLASVTRVLSGARRQRPGPRREARAHFELHGLTAWPTAASASHCERELLDASLSACCGSADNKLERRGRAALIRLSMPGDCAQHMAGAPRSARAMRLLPPSDCLPPELAVQQSRSKGSPGRAVLSNERPKHQYPQIEPSAPCPCCCATHMRPMWAASGGLMTRAHDLSCGAARGVWWQRRHHWLQALSPHTGR